MVGNWTDELAAVDISGRHRPRLMKPRDIITEIKVKILSLVKRARLTGLNRGPYLFLRGGLIEEYKNSPRYLL